MIYKGIEIVQKNMLEILKYIDEICNREKITYFLDGGNHIGALRHKGFIPWDDDIDISLFKKDYLRLIELLRKEKKVYFYYDDFSSHCCQFIFIPNKYWQIQNGSIFPSVYPIKLDIRPLNVINNSAEDIKVNNLYRSCAEFILFGKIKNISQEEIKKTIFNFGGNQLFLEFYNTKYGLIEPSDNTLCAHPYFTYSVENPLPSNCFLPVKKVCFENFNTFIPGTDEFLKLYYGDYMLLPKKTEQIPYAKGVVIVKKSLNHKLSNLFVKRICHKANFIEKIKIKLLMKFFTRKLR